jgi:hypothetical protein
VPEDLNLKGGRERFTITVTFDTLELYGKVTGSREVVVEKKPSPEH